ncbi:MAG: hypothetical protein IJB38_02905 [Bacteroidales bacterium]|nr:hypothetical protein [Bacteroidales bacterium]
MQEIHLSDPLIEAITSCTEDIRTIAAYASMSLDMQSCAYDLLDALLAAKEVDSTVFQDNGFKAVTRSFIEIYDKSADVIGRAFNEEVLVREAAERQSVFDKDLLEARFKAAAAESLHEFAKETFEVWQNSGIFARRRALKALRDRAGFRLESHRIGNYVAKTYDLMEEARREHQKAQQASFAANVTYKIRAGVYSDIYRLLTENR